MCTNLCVQGGCCNSISVSSDDAFVLHRWWSGYCGITRVLGECKREQKAQVHLKIKGLMLIHHRHLLFDLRSNRSLSLSTWFVFLSCLSSKFKTQVHDSATFLLRSFCNSVQSLALNLPTCFTDTNAENANPRFSFSSAVICISAAAWPVCDCAVTALWWAWGEWSSCPLLCPHGITTHRAQGLQMMKEESDVSFFSFLTVCSPLLCVLTGCHEGLFKGH